MTTALGAISIGALPGSYSALGAPTGLVRQQSNQTARHIYIVAHEDDWQLFMGDDVAAALGDGTEATFIYLTAGDDGRDSTRRNGAGFARDGYQSLRKLRRKRITSLNAVDRSTVYANWSDLVATVDEVAGAASTDSRPVLYSTDPSITINPHDHFDHRIAGLLVEEVRKRHDWPARYYVGYALASRAANRPAQLAQLKTAVFRAYDNVMIRAEPAWSAYAEHPTFYAECMQRTYSRPVPRRIHP